MPPENASLQCSTQVEKRPLHAPVPHSHRRQNKEGQGQGTEAQQAEPGCGDRPQQNANLNTRGPHRRLQARSPHCSAGGASDPSAPGTSGPWARFVPFAQRAEPSHPHTKPLFKPEYQQLLPRRPARSPSPPGPSPVRVGREDSNTLRHGSGRPSVPRRGHHGRARSQQGGESPAPARRRVFRPGCGLVRGKGHGRRGRGDPRVRTSPPRRRPAVRASFSTGARARCPRARKAAGHPRPELSRARTRRLPAAADPEATHAGLRGTAPRSSDLHTAGARGVPESRASPAGNTAGTREEPRAGVPHTKRARKSHSSTRTASGFYSGRATSSRSGPATSSTRSGTAGPEPSPRTRGTGAGLRDHRHTGPPRDLLRAPSRPAGSGPGGEPGG